MKKSVCALLLLFPALIGCSHSNDPAVVDAAQAQLTPSVSSYAEMTFIPASDMPKEVSPIGPGDPVFDFGPQGKSYFKAVELPKSDAPYVMEVVNYVTHPGRGMGFRIFLPSFIFLDENFSPVQMPVFQGPVYINGEHSFIERYVQYCFNPNSKVRYAIIYTTRDSQLKGVMAPYGHPGVAMAAGLYIPIGGKLAPLRGTADGIIGVAIKPLSVGNE